MCGEKVEGEGGMGTRGWGGREEGECLGGGEVWCVGACVGVGEGRRQVCRGKQAAAKERHPRGCWEVAGGRRREIRGVGCRWR